MVNIGKNTHKKLRLEVSKKEHTPKWVVPTMAGGWFSGLLILFWLYSVTAISIWETLKHLLFFSVSFTLIPYKWVVKFIPLDYPFIITLNFLGLGPILTSMFFLANFMLATPIETQVVQIVNTTRGEGFSATSTVIELKNETLQDYPKFRTFDQGSHLQIVTYPYFSYTLSNGLFGYPVLSTYDFTTKPK